jgi:hypothetical protein
MRRKELATVVAAVLFVGVLAVIFGGANGV